MLNKKNILVIIPARGGSKGLPNKNILKLCGKPLIAWSIEKAKRSKCVDRVIVSTDSIEIANIAKKYGAEVPFLRPAEFATDTASPTDAILHLIEELEKKGDRIDIVIELQPVCFIRESEDIDKCIQQLVNNANAESIISVTEISSTAHPDFAASLNEENFIVAPSGFADRFRRQNLSKKYAASGYLLASYASSLKKYKSFYNKATLGFVVSEKQKTFDINDIWDFVAVEAIIKYSKKYAKN